MAQTHHVWAIQKHDRYCLIDPNPDELEQVVATIKYPAKFAQHFIDKILRGIV